MKTLPTVRPSVSTAAGKPAETDLAREFLKHPNLFESNLRVRCIFFHPLMMTVVRLLPFPRLFVDVFLSRSTLRSSIFRFRLFSASWGVTGRAGLGTMVVWDADIEWELRERPGSDVRGLKITASEMRGTDVTISIETLLVLCRKGLSFGTSLSNEKARCSASITIMPNISTI